MARLEQVKGMGTLVALTYGLRLEARQVVNTALTTLTGCGQRHGDFVREATRRVSPTRDKRECLSRLTETRLVIRRGRPTLSSIGLSVRLVLRFPRMPSGLLASGGVS
jgi:hypothetical protein